MENDDFIISDDSINSSEFVESEEVDSEEVESEEVESEEVESEEVDSEEVDSEEVDSEEVESEEVENQKEVNHEAKSESSAAYTTFDPIDYSDKFEAIEKSLNLNTASLIALVLLFGLLKGLKKI